MIPILSGVLKCNFSAGRAAKIPFLHSGGHFQKIVRQSEMMKK